MLVLGGHVVKRLPGRLVDDPRIENCEYDPNYCELLHSTLKGKCKWDNPTEFKKK